MHDILAVHTDRADTLAAAEHLAAQITAGLNGAPDAIILFASSAFDYALLLTELKTRCRPTLLVGSSSAGEFTQADRGTGTASALAIRSTDLTLTAAIGH